MLLSENHVDIRMNLVPNHGPYKLNDYTKLTNHIQIYHKMRGGGELNEKNSHQEMKRTHKMRGGRAHRALGFACGISEH